MRGSSIFFKGGSRPDGQKKVWTTFFFSKGSNFFPGGGGVQMLISIETHITCDFPGGGGSEQLSPSGSALFFFLFLSFFEYWHDQIMIITPGSAILEF